MLLIVHFADVIQSISSRPGLNFPLNRNSSLYTCLQLTRTRALTRMPRVDDTLTQLLARDSSLIMQLSRRRVKPNIYPMFFPPIFFNQ